MPCFSSACAGQKRVLDVEALEKTMRNLMAVSVLGTFVLSACVAGSEKAEIVTEPLTKSEINNLLVNHSYPLGAATIEGGKGALYFASSTALEAVWKGNAETATWEAMDDSSFCYDLKMFGKRECITLERNVTEGGYVHTFDGQKRYLKDGAIVEGKAF